MCRMMFPVLAFLAFATTSLCQTQTTPVPILKQINRQNEDGSYSYGYENADGSYKIESKSANGEIAGKYGYIDESGKLREIEYGASSKRGFEPVGPGITVPPPTLHVQNENTIDEYDDGQYREDPSIYYKTEQPLNSKIPAAKPSPSAPFNVQNFRLESQFNSQHAQFNTQPAQFNTQPAQFNTQPAQFNPQPAPANYNWYRQPQSAAYNPAIFQGHPATNFDPFSGSYTINYTG